MHRGRFQHFLHPEFFPDFSENLKYSLNISKTELPHADDGHVGGAHNDHDHISDDDEDTMAMMAHMESACFPFSIFT